MVTSGFLNKIEKINGDCSNTCVRDQTGLRDHRGSLSGLEVAPITQIMHDVKLDKSAPRVLTICIL